MDPTNIKDLVSGGRHSYVVNADDGRDEETKTEKNKYAVVYSVNETPPWYLVLPLGLQHILTMFGATVSLFFVAASSLCVDNNLVLKSQMVGTMFFVMGIATILNSTFGIRLPIVQGTTAAVVMPVVSMAKAFGTCPAMGNSTIGAYTEEIIYPRLQQVSGTLMVASTMQILIGVSGAVSLLLRFIGPLVIAPTISLIGLSLFKVAAQKSEGQWWIALMTSLLICIFTYFLSLLRVPFCVRDKDSGRCVVKRFAIFRTCPVILAIGVSWAICAILTVTNVLPSDPTKWGYHARTDTRSSVISTTPWAQFPYPGRWGLPKLFPLGLLGVMAALITSVVESVGDYYACARMSGAPPPPTFAVNRGMTIEGLCCIICGLLGLPIGTTSYSENVGAIGITRVGSRRVVQAAALFMLLFGIIPKFGAVFVSIPDPVFGGVFITMFGMLSGVGMSNLQFIDLNSTRNLFVLGSALFMGLMVPEWVNANSQKLSTGSAAVDASINILLTISIFVGGAVALALDLILPGSDEERGIKKWRKTFDGNEEASRRDIIETYDLSIFTRLFSRFSWLRFLPVCPTYSKYTEQPPSPTAPEDGGRTDDNPTQSA